MGFLPLRWICVQFIVDIQNSAPTVHSKVGFGRADMVNVELLWNVVLKKTSIRRGVQSSVVQEMMLFYHQKNQRSKKSKTKKKKFTSECGCLNQLRWALQYSLPFEGTKNKTELMWVVGLGFRRAFLSSTTNVKKTINHWWKMPDEFLQGDIPTINIYFIK